MSVTHSRERIRIALEVESHEPQTDEIAGGQPQMWRNNDVQFEIGLFLDGAPRSLSDYQSLTLFVKDNDNRTGGPNLMLRTIAAADITPTFTAEEWDNKEKQHCVFPFSAAETRLDMQGGNTREFWLSVFGLTTDGKRITVGSTILKLHHDGYDEENITPPLGSSLITPGVSYSGTGLYTKTGLTAGRTYSYSMGANDTKLVNGAQELAESGNFVANGTSVILHGTANELVTATLRYPVYLNIDEMDSRYLRGKKPWETSPNGRYMRIMGVDDNGRRLDQVIDLQNPA